MLLIADAQRACFSHRCKTKTSGWHISNAQKRQAGWGKATEESETTVIKQWRTVGRRLRPHHYGVHLLVARPPACKLLFFLRMFFFSCSGHSQEKKQQGRHLEPIKATYTGRGGIAVCKIRCIIFMSKAVSDDYIKNPFPVRFLL